MKLFKIDQTRKPDEIEFVKFAKPAGRGTDDSRKHMLGEPIETILPCPSLAFLPGRHTTSDCGMIAYKHPELQTLDSGSEMEAAILRTAGVLDRRYKRRSAVLMC